MTDTTNQDQKIALVTGANRGIGQAIAQQLAALGMTVLVGTRDLGRCARTIADLRATGADAHPVVLEVTDPETIQAAAGYVDERYGRLDILINNAGISGTISQAPTRADLDNVRAVFETNVFGVLSVTNTLLYLLRRAAAGRIVNLTSGVGSLTRMSDPADAFAALPASAAYGPAKTALNALTVQYAKELRTTNILINAADPGACATDFTRPLGRHLDRTAAQGAAIAVRLATLGADGPSGLVFNDAGPVTW